MKKYSVIGILFVVLMIGMIGCWKNKEGSSSEAVPGEVMMETESAQVEEASLEESVAEEIVVEETAIEDTVAEETAAEETVAKETTSQKPAAKETTSKKAPVKETTAKETTAKETTVKETTAKETTVKETTAKETTPEETAAEESSEIPEEFLPTDEETAEEILHEDHPMIPGERYEFTWPSVISSGEIWIGGKRLMLFDLNAGDDERDTFPYIEYGSHTVEMEGKMGNNYMPCYACITGEDTFYALVQCPLGNYDNVCTRIWKITVSTEALEYCGMIQGHIPSEDYWVSDDEIYLKLWEDEPYGPHYYACYQLSEEGLQPVDDRTYSEDPIK